MRLPLRLNPTFLKPIHPHHQHQHQHQQMEFFSNGVTRRHRRREKVVVIMGPTGSGKSRLSVELATHFNGEVINSDKIQVYKGLNITTNKIPLHEQRGVPHHLLGEFDSSSGELTHSEFRSHATSSISSITARGHVPILAGGSNSFIRALLSDSLSRDSLRYACCFLWVDVALPVLKQYLIKRVDDMLDSGMVDELAEFYDSGEIDESLPNSGIRKAIGVPEFETYFRGGSDRLRRGVYEEAVRAIKENTCQLAKRQMEKIQRLRCGGWELNRLDGTDSFRKVLEGSKDGSNSCVWDRQVLTPSIKIVKSFLG